jgi:hypothetical protein
MGKKRNFDFDKDAFDSLQVGECLEAEIAFPGEDEPMRMKVCRTKKGLKEQKK